MHKHTILLIEDNHHDSDMTLWAFDQSNLNAEIIVAHDGNEALDLLRPADPCIRLCPALVLLDVNMPGMSGLDLLRRLRADPLTRCLPVIMLTGFPVDSDMIASYSLGANGYVRKPMRSADLIDVVTTLGTYWLGLNQTPPLSAN